MNSDSARYLYFALVYSCYMKNALVFSQSHACHFVEYIIIAYSNLLWWTHPEVEFEKCLLKLPHETIIIIITAIFTNCVTVI